MPAIEEQDELPSVAIHVSRTGQVQITLTGAVCAMDDVSGQAVLTISATQLQELKSVLSDYVPD